MTTGQKVSGLATVLMTSGFLGAASLAAIYKEGKTVLDTECRIEIVKMQWGKNDETTDRIIGKVRRYGVTDVTTLLKDKVILVFDVFARATAASGQASERTTDNPYGVARAPEKIKTHEITFTFQTYGYRTQGKSQEGEFCVDFPVIPEAGRITLSNVKINGEPVTYKTQFNISGSLIRTAFGLPEPKAIAVRR